MHRESCEESSLHRILLFASLIDFVLRFDCSSIHHTPPGSQLLLCDAEVDGIVKQRDCFAVEEA